MSAEPTLGSEQGAKSFHVEPGMWRIRYRRNLSNKHTINLKFLLSLLRPLSGPIIIASAIIKRHYQPILQKLKVYENTHWIIYKRVP